MQFNSYSYLLLLAIAVGVFWTIPVALRRTYVLAVSLAFCATWNAYLVLLPFGLALLTYACARRATAVGIGAVIAVLAFFKYRGFLAGGPLFTSIALPLGISFYSFEAISYLIDSHQGRNPSRSFVELWLFLVFWPHLIAGPIVRTQELIPQLKFDRPFDRRFVFTGMDRLLLGLVQKNLIANSLGSWIDDGFLSAVASTNTTLDNWSLAVAFGLQIYFDFAAYSNMAIGAAALIGVTLPENFRMPYHAATPPDFWSRWHMTLSRWIRDYVFFPLTMHSRGAAFYASTIGVMALVGLWHGAGWGFVVWGVMHGVYLAVYRMARGSAPIAVAGARSKLFWRVFTLAAVTAAWVPFRSATLSQAATMLASMFWRFSRGWSYSVNFYLVTLLACGFCAVEPLLQRMIDRIDERAASSSAVTAMRFLLRPAAWACLLLLFVIFDDRDTQFIYFQF